MEKRVKKDEISFRQAENQLVRPRIVLTTNDRKPNKLIFSLSKTDFIFLNSLLHQFFLLAFLFY